MTYVHTIYTLTAETEIHERYARASEAIALELSEGPTAISIVLPPRDDDAEGILALLSAAIDNAASHVQLRRQRAKSGEEVVGWNGAGASVEAARG